MRELTPEQVEALEVIDKFFDQQPFIDMTTYRGNDLIDAQVDTIIRKCLGPSFNTQDGRQLVEDYVIFLWEGERVYYVADTPYGATLGLYRPDHLSLAAFTEAMTGYFKEG